MYTAYNNWIRNVTTCRKSIERLTYEIDRYTILKREILSGRSKVREINPKWKGSVSSYIEFINSRLDSYEHYLAQQKRRLERLYDLLSEYDREYLISYEFNEVKERIERDGYINGSLVGNMRF